MNNVWNFTCNNITLKHIGKSPNWQVGRNDVCGGYGKGWRDCTPCTIKLPIRQVAIRRIDDKPMSMLLLKHRSMLPAIDRPEREVKASTPPTEEERSRDEETEKQRNQDAKPKRSQIRTSRPRVDVVDDSQPFESDQDNFETLESETNDDPQQTKPETDDDEQQDKFETAVDPQSVEVEVEKISPPKEDEKPAGPRKSLAKLSVRSVKPSDLRVSKVGGRSTSIISTASGKKASMKITSGKASIKSTSGSPNSPSSGSSISPFASGSYGSDSNQSGNRKKRSRHDLDVSIDLSDGSESSFSSFSFSNHEVPEHCAKMLKCAGGKKP